MNAGDVVLTPLPQSDGRVKNRPTIALRRMPGFGDWLLCGVSTQLHQEIPGVGLGARTEPCCNPRGQTRPNPKAAKKIVGLRFANPTYELPRTCPCHRAPAPRAVRRRFDAHGHRSASAHDWARGSGPVLCPARGQDLTGH